MANPRPRRFSINTEPGLFADLGLDPSSDGSVEIEAALGRYAKHLATASRDVVRKLNRDEWCYLADVCNGTLWDVTPTPPATLLVANAEDAQQLNGTGAKWFGDSDSAPRAVAELADKLAKLTPIQAEAVMVAIRWFWANHESIDLMVDPWWTSAFRAARARAAK